MSERSLWQPFNRDFKSDPYPYYDRLRAEQPFYKAVSGEYIISRYADVKQILLDDRFLAGNRLEWLKKGVDYLQHKDHDFQELISALQYFLLMLNPPRHTEIRKFLSSEWDINSLENGINEFITSEISKIEYQEINFVETLARPITANTISLLLGVKNSEVVSLQDHSMKLIKAIDAYTSFKELVQMHEGAVGFIEYFERKIYNKEIAEESYLGRIINKNDKERVLNDQELVSTALFLFLAGTETTVSSLSYGAMYVAENNIDKDIVVRLFVEELFRYVGPIHMLGRIAAEDIKLDDHLIPKNSVVTLLLASANRDKNYFEKAQIFDPCRNPNRHLAFGQGRHYCLGDKLGKMQVYHFWKQLMESNLKIKKAGDVKYEDQLSIRGVKNLPVVIK